MKIHLLHARSSASSAASVYYQGGSFQAQLVTELYLKSHRRLLTMDAYCMRVSACVNVCVCVFGGAGRRGLVVNAKINQ